MERSWEQSHLLACRFGISRLIARLITTRRVRRPWLERMWTHVSLGLLLWEILVTDDLRLPPGVEAYQDSQLRR